MAKLPGNDDVRSSRNAWDATVTFDAAEPEPIQDEPMPAPPPVQSGPSDDDLMNELRALGGDNPTSFSIPNLFDGQSATDSPAFDALSKDGTLDKIVRDADVSKKADDQRAVADSADGTNVGVMGRSWGMLSPAESKDWLTGELKDARHASAIAEQTRTQTQQAIDTFRKIAPGKPLPPWLAEQEAFQKEVEKDRGKRLQTAYDMEAGKIPMAQKGVIRSGSEQLVQGVSGIISGMVKSAGIAAGFAGKVSGVDIGPDDNMTYRFGQWIEDKTRELFPGDVARQAEFGQKLAQGAGSMIGFYGPAIIGKIMGASNAKLVALTATTGALAEGSSTFDEALLSQKQGREVSDMAKFLAWGGGLLLGTTEALPVASLIKGGRGSLVTAMLSQMIEQGGQEGFQTFGENVLAKVLHDPDRNLSDNVMENLAIGGLLGGFITGGSFAVSRKMREAERAAGAAEQAQVGLQVEEPKDAQPAQPIIPQKPAKAARSSADIGDQPIASTPIQTPASVENEVVTPDGSLALPVETVLVELEDLVHATGDLQPRDRSLKESSEQTRYVAANLDPSRLMPQRVSDVGAPVIAPDGTILSGNMRTMALGEVYRDPQLAARAQAYRAFLPPEAATMKAPVLVRRIKGDVTQEQLVSFADKSNRPAIAQMGATERAARDARAAGGEVMRLYTGGEFTRVENRPFLRAFVNAAVAPTERGAMARDGLLTKEGEDRLTNAVLAATYAKPELLARMLESTDDNIRAISGAMRDAAGIILGLKQSVENGETAPEFDITPQIAEAALRIAMWRQKGIKPADALAQQDAFTQIDPTVEAIVRAFYNEDLTRPVSRKAMTEFLVYYANEAKLHSGQQGLIPDETSPQDVLELSRDRVIRGDVARDTADLFAQGEGLGRGDLAGDGQIAVEPGPDGGGLALGQEAGDVGTEEFSAKFVPGKQAGKKDRKAAVDQGQQDFFSEVFASAVDELSSITTDEQRAAFRAVLAGTSPRKDWAGLVGATSPQIEALEQEAIRDGLLRQTKTGQVRRTAKAKDVGPRAYTVDDVRNGVVVRSQEMSAEAWSKLKMDLKMQQPFETVEQMLDVAGKAQERLGEVGRAISEKTGATFRFPKIKGRERIEEKLAGRDPRNLTDVSRAGFDANTIAQSDELIDDLAKSFGIVDEGWAVIADSGYFDRKAMLYFQNRVIGEIQIWPPGMFSAKEEKGGHELYEISRSPKASPEEKADALVKQRDLYAQTISEMPQEFQDFAEALRSASAAPISAAGNIAASSARETSGQSRASAPITGLEGPISQPLSGAMGSTPAAFSPETTAGPSRNTKYPKFRSISSPPSTLNMGANQQNFNLSIPADERISRVISLRENVAGITINAVVSDYAYRIEEARTQGVAGVEALVNEIAADKVMRKADALELAHLVGYPPKKSTTKKAALQSIVERAKDFADGQQVADLFAQEQANAQDDLRGPEGGVLEGQPPQGLPADAEGRLPGGASQAGTDGRLGDVRPATGADAGITGPAEGVSPEAGGDRADTGDGGRDRAERDRVRALVEKQNADRRARVAENYHITDDDQIGAGGAKGKVSDNIAAIKILRVLDEENRRPTPDEKKVLVKYTGWGAFSQAIFDPKTDTSNAEKWQSERKELKNILSREEWESAKESTINAHYTSPEVIRGMYQALAHMGWKGEGRAIEPSAGVGHFIGLQEQGRDQTAWTAVELDTLTGGILKALYGGADVRVAGFETQKFPNDFFDLAISNVPFGKTGPHDPAYNKLKLNLHNYFFVKSLDKVRPGGIVAFITSSFTMDSKNDLARREMMMRADLIGAIRLPGGSKGAFKANAGTDVTTDILFLRKRGEADPTPDWARNFLELEEIKTPEGPTLVNTYFANNPDMMLGKMRLVGTQYGPGEPALIGSSADLDVRIADLVSAQFPQDVFVPAGRTPAEDLTQTMDAETDGIKEGAFYEKAGKVYRKVEGVGRPVTGAAAAKKLRSFMAVRDIVNDLLGRQAKGERGLDGLRKDLEKAYDSFVKEYGPIRKTQTTVTKRANKAGEPIIIRKMPNFSVFKDDPDAYKVAAIEIYDEKTDRAEKTAIFYQDVLAANVEPDVKSPVDALAVSLNSRGKVDMPLIAEKLAVSEDEAAALLGDMVYLDPAGGQWHQASAYLSGDVKTKLADARAAAETDPSFARNVAALEEVQPPDLSRADIRLLFGAPWINPQIYNRFIEEFMGARRNSVEVRYLPGSRRWIVHTADFPYASVTAWGIDGPTRGSSRSPKEILEAALNNTSTTIKVTTGSGENQVTYVDQKLTEEAAAKVQAIRDNFGGDPKKGIDSWAWNSEATASELEATYNEAMNRIVKEEHDGSHLTMPNLAEVISFGNGETGKINRPKYRMSAIWRIITKGNALLAHSVGAGKTFTMIMSGMEQKRLGLIQRPAYVVPNHMLEQFSGEFLQAYPNAKLLVVDKDSMSKDKRKEFAARVAAEKWDGVIVTHDVFGRIAMSDQFTIDFIQKEIDDLEAFIRREADIVGEFSDDYDGKDPTVKDLVKRRKRLRERLLKLINKERKDEGVTFEEIGIDFLYVDEAHLFKNLPFNTKHTRIKGISTSASQRAQDLYMKIQYLEKSKPGRSVVFATGTPVSNTMAELYIMQKYLQPKALQAYGLDEFDSWASTFGDVTSTVELAPNGRTMRTVRAFKRFVNIPELMTLYGEVADVQTAAMLKLPVPKLKGNTPQMVLAEMTDTEMRIMDSHVKRAEEIKGQKPEKGADNMLKIMGEGLQLATDIRLLDPAAPFNPNGKVAKATENIFRIWKEGKKPALGQIVFLDMGVPGSQSQKKINVEDFTDEDVEASDEGTGDIEDSIFAGNFNLYQDMKDRLVEMGVPKDQIAFIHDANDDIKKARMFGDVKSGKIRILFGSTGKMGVGTNVQKYLVAMHHIDAPWRPADLQQRDGRIIRQGNLNEQVEIFRYITERSMDAYRWQTLQSKSEFIAQLEAGARGVREAEDIDSPLPEAAAIKAAATGNPAIMEHAELTKSVRELEAGKRVHERAIIAARRAYQEVEAQKTFLEKNIADLEADAERVEDMSGDNFAMTLTLTGTERTVSDRKKVGEAIKAYLNTVGQRLWVGQKADFEVGTISGFPVSGFVRRVNLEERSAWFQIYGQKSYETNEFLFDDDTDQVQIVNRITRAISGIRDRIPEYKEKLARAISEMPKLAKQSEMTPFPREQELRDKNARLLELEFILNPEARAKAEAQKAEIERQNAAEAEGTATDEQGMGALSTGLDMSPEASKARAEAAGFNTSFVAYRGLWDQYDTEYAQYADMQMFSRDKEVARGYGDVIVQAYLRLGKNLEIFAFGSDWDRIKKDALPTDVVEELGLRDGDLSVRAIALAAKRVGYDSLTVHDVYDHDSGIREAPTTVDVVFKAKDVRSTKAAFNPAQDESANLYAAMTTGMRDSFPEWTEAVVSEARKLLPADVALRIKDRIQAGGFNFDARYLPISKALEIAATNGPKRALALARHEAIHVARSMNLFTAEEWALLLERAEKLNIDDQITTVDQKTGKQIPAIPVYREMYAKQAGLNALSGADADAYVSERINQERVAKMAELWEGGAQYGSKVDSLIDRIARLLEAMVNAIRGLGFQSVGDVADSFLAGDVARRKRIEPTLAPVPFSQTAEGMAALDGFGLGGLRLTDQDRIGYFSGALRAAYNLRQEKGTPEQMLAMLQKEGAKKAEIEATGLDKFILGRETDTGAAGDGRPSATGAASAEGRTAGQGAANVSRNQITKSEIIKYLEDNRIEVREVERGLTQEQLAAESRMNELRDQMQAIQREDYQRTGGFRDEKALAADNPEYAALVAEYDALSARNFGPDRKANEPTKWSSYSLDPNNPTYRETVLHLPLNKGTQSFDEFVREKFGKSANELLPETRRIMQSAYDIARQDLGASNFNSGHFSEPNIVGHMMTSTVKHDGKATYLIDQIQSDWGQKLRDGGVRDEAKIAELKKRISKIGPSPAWLSDNGANDSTALKAEIASMFKTGLLRRSGLTEGEERALGIIFARSDGPDGINGGINEIHQKGLVASSDMDTLLTKIKNRPDVENRLSEIDAAIKAGANRRLLMAELRTAEAATPGHPLVNTTDQWTNTTLRRAIRQAVEADAEYIAIPHGDTVLSYNPGQEGMLGFYGSRTEEGIVPKNLRKLLQKMDRNTPPPQRVEKLETSQGAQGWNSEEKYPFNKGNTGFTIFKLTDKVKQSVIDEGQALFALTAYHGSPSDFTSFDWQKMRSGGGHTDVVTPGLHYYAFGHHFGSDKRVAGEYQRVVARKLFNGKPFDLNSPAHVAANALANMNGDRAAAIADLEERASYHEAQAGSRLLRAFGGGSSAAVQDAVVSRKAADILRANREASRSLSGGLYEVSLDLDESDVLDFGKTLSSHGTKIRTAALAFVKDALPRLEAQMETRDLSADEFDVLSSLVRIAKDEPETLTGADVVTLAGGPREDASLAMKAAGIRAVKYRDQYSRDAVGSFNYVVFDDDVITVKSKDGKPVSDAERAGVMGSMASEAMGALRAPDPQRARPFGPSGDVTVRTKPDGTRVRTYKDGASFAAISETSDGTWAVQMADGPEAAGILQRIEQDIGQRLAPDGWLSPESYSYWQAAKPQALRSHVNAGPLFGNMWVPVSAIDPAINVLGEVVTRGADTDRRAKAARQIQQLRAIKMQAAPSVADEVLPALQGLPSPINLGSAYQGTGESTERLDVSLSNLVAKVNTSLGLITRMGRLNPGLKAMASRRGGSIGGQYSKKTGVTRLAIPNDIVTLAHEGGHAIENRYDTKAAVAGLKAKFAEDLILPPAPDVPAPQMPSTGFSGIEIDAETQAVLIEAVQKKARLKQMGATVGMAKQGRGPGYDARLYAQLQEEAGSAREILKRRLGQQITDAVMADLDASGAQDFAAYTAQRFAETGQPQPRLQLAFTATQLSEAWGDWFAQYVTAPDLARTISPGLYAAFETEMDGIDPGMLEGLEAVQDGYQRLLASSPVEALRSRVQTTVRPGKIGALRDQIAKDGVANTITNWVYSFYSAVIDGKHPMKVAVKYLLKTYTQNTGLKLGDDERLVLKAIDDPYKRWRLAEHSKVQATNILQNGVRLKGQDINQGVSYHDALKHAFGGTWSSQWNEEKAELFGSYLIARRMLFEFTRFDAGALEREPDLLMQRDVWRQSKDRIETTNPEFAQAADILYEFNRNLLQWKFEEGFIDPQTYQDLLQRDDYVPLNRIMDDEDGPITLTTPRGANKRKMLQRFKGSTRDFINPLESIAQDVYATQARVALNGVIRSMDTLARAAGPGGGAIAERLPATEIKGTKVNLREVLRSAAKTEGLAQDDTEALMELIDDLFDQEASGNIFRATDINEKGERIVYLWEGGKRVPIRLGDDRIGKDIFDQMVAFGTDNANLAVDVATGFTQVLRAGVTKAPAYVLTNLFRDQFATWVLSSAYTPFVSATKGMKDTVSSGDQAIRYQAAAGMMGGVDTHLMNTAARGHDVLTLRKKGFWAVPGGTVVGRTWNGFLRTMEITEAATRVGHFDALYKRALADGMTPEEALFEAGYMAHDVMDFSRRGGGPGMQSLTRMVAFLNASVQALDAARRTMTGERNLDTAYRRIATPYIKAVNGSPLSVAERQQLPESARMWLKMASIMMIGVALAAYYRDDDEYEELSDYMRSTHWFFKLNGTWYRYPKPFELATLSNAGEAAFEAYWKQDPRALTQFLHGLQHTMVPPHEIQAAKFIYELKSGKDMFRDRDIIGMDIAKLPPELQYNAYTSELGKMIGAVTGTSPAMVDHFMATGGATIARDVMSATDYLLPRMNQAVGGKIPGVSVTPRAEKSVEDYWFVSRFTRRMARGALSTEYFWNQMSPTSGEYAQAAAGYKRLYEAGRVDPRKSIEAKALLDNLTDDQKAYAMLETYFSEKEQDLNPLNRARQVMSAASGIRKEMLMGSIVLQDSKKKNREIEAISLTPTQQRSVNEILEDYAMREARNALIVTGIEGWAQKSEMATAGLIEELRRVHEGVADEFEARVTSGRNKVYPYEAIKRLWPEARKRLLEDGQDAVLNDLAAEARSY